MTPPRAEHAAARQAGYCTALPSPVRREAKRAAHVMNRAPISDLLSL